MRPNPSLDSITFRRTPPSDYMANRSHLQFQVLSYHSCDVTPEVVRNYQFEHIIENGDLYRQPAAEASLKNANYWLQLYGRTREGYSVCLHVNYWPCLIVALPPGWNKGNAQELMAYLKTGSVVSWDVKYWHRLAGFHPDMRSDTHGLAKFPFLHIWCRSLAYVRRIRNSFTYRKHTVSNVRDYQFEVWESDIPPVLQFIETCKAKPSGVIQIKASDIKTINGGRITHCDIEYECLFRHFYNQIESIEVDELFPIVILSFDIECVPANDKSFPNAASEDDKVIAVCMTTKNMSTGDTLRTVHALGNYYQLDDSILQFRFDNECKMLEHLRDTIIKIDPDCTTGYNIHGFDWPYLNTRMENFDKFSRFFYLSRVIRYRCVMEEKQFSSKAHGSSTTKQFHIPGRIDIDLYTYMLRNYKLKSYQLGSVSRHFLKNDKVDLKISDMFKNFRSGDPKKLAQNVEYCIRDTELPILLFENQKIFESIIEMSRVTYVFLQDLFQRGQMFKVVSLLYVIGRAHNFILTRPPKSDHVDGYKGATVLDMRPGFYEMLAVLDFAALYPSIMKENNLCYTSLVTDEKYANLPHYEYKEFKTETGTHRFQQTHRGLLPLIIDQLLDARRTAKHSMNVAKSMGNVSLAALLDARQLALKVSCNSIYGFTGAVHSKYYAPQIASSVTCEGRALIDKTKRLIQNKYIEEGADVIYGDTDSVMVHFTKIPDSNEGFGRVFDVATEAAEYVSRSVGSAIELEMEKVYRPAIMQVKKHYAALAFETKHGKGKIDVKGISLVRRDFCDFQQKIYAKVLDVLLYERDIDKSLRTIADGLQRLIDRKVPFEEFILSRKLSADYKNQNITQNIVAKRIESRTPGSGPRAGDRVDYVVVVIPFGNAKAPLYKKVEDVTYARDHKLKIDIIYYIKTFVSQMASLMEPFNVQHRLKKIFTDYLASAHQIIYYNASILQFYNQKKAIPESTNTVSFKQPAKKDRVSMFSSNTQPRKKTRNSVFMPTKTIHADQQNKSMFSQKIKKTSSILK